MRYLKKYFAHICSLTLALTLIGCVPQPIDIDLDPAPPEIVVASQVIPDQIMFVLLTRSFSALAIDTEQDSVTAGFLEDLFVERARVTVRYRNRTDTLFHLGNGVYASLWTLQFGGESYTLHVHDSLTGKEVSATTTMQPFIGFDTLYPVIEGDDEDNPSLYMDITLTDPPGRNWYAVNIVRRNDANQSSNIDLNQFFSGGQAAYTQVVLLSDQSFSGAQHRERILLDENFERDDSITVSISNVSEGYFKYLEAFQRSQGLLSSVTQEPINRPSNVEGGFGFFNAHYPDIRVFDLSAW